MSIEFRKLFIPLVYAFGVVPYCFFIVFVGIEHNFADWLEMVNGYLSVRVTTKLWKIADHHQPSSGRKGDHEVVDGARESIRTNIAKNP